MPQGGDRLRWLKARINEVFGQGSDDPISPGIDIGYSIRMLPGRLNHTGGSRVNHRSDPAGLCVECVVAVWHTRLTLSG